MKDEEREAALHKYKVRSLMNFINPFANAFATCKFIQITLYDWYFSNMLELTTEECERAEYAKLMTEFRKCVNKTIYGKLLFRLSRINKHVEYFACNVFEPEFGLNFCASC